MIEARTPRDVVVRMADGEDVLAQLAALGIDSAVLVCGIGMLRNAELGYWNGEQYEKHLIEAPVELVSLQGTVARFGEEIAVHIHVCVAAADGTTSGGHLFAGTVHNTAEIALSLVPGIRLERVQEETGLSGLVPRAT